MLTGVGLKIAINFFAMTYEIPEGLVSEVFWNGARIQMFLISAVGFAVFIYLLTKFQTTQPAIPYFVLIIAGALLAQLITMPMLHVEDVPLSLHCRCFTLTVL